MAVILIKWSKIYLFAHEKPKATDHFSDREKKLPLNAYPIYSTKQNL